MTTSQQAAPDAPPRVRPNLIPQFAVPPTMPTDPPPVGPAPTDPTGPAPEAPAPEEPRRPNLRERLSQRPAGPAGADTPTATSSVGKPTEKQTAELVAGLVGLVVVAAASIVSWRAQRQLRRPSEKQLDDFATPLARIARRHATLDVLNPDLMDVLAAGTVAGNYLSDGPLTTTPAVHDGVPSNLGDIQ